MPTSVTWRVTRWQSTEDHRWRLAAVSHHPNGNWAEALSVARAWVGQGVDVHMKPTELLITAYDGDISLFTTTLTPEKACTILTGAGRNGDTVVEHSSEKETQAFEPITQILLDVVNPPRRERRA